MALNFPSPPAERMPYNAYPGLSFIFRDGVWAKAPLTTALPKNCIGNPAMQISQEQGNAASANLNGFYAADQWFLSRSGTMASSFQRVQAATPRGANDRLRNTVTTTQASIGASDWLGVVQMIEGNHTADLQWGTVNAIPVVVRFGFKAPAGTYSCAIRNRAYTYAYSMPIVVSAGQANTDVEYAFAVPGCTTGVWSTDTTCSIELWFAVAAGTSLQVPTLAWMPSGGIAGNGISNGVAALNTFELFDVGLYADPYWTGVAPPFEIPDPAQELRRCQRYWHKSFGSRGWAAGALNASRNAQQCPAPMRAQPALAVVGTPKVFDGTVTPAITSVNTNVSNFMCVEAVYVTTTGGLTNLRPTVQYWDSEASYIAASARV